MKAQCPNRRLAAIWSLYGADLDHPIPTRRRGGSTRPFADLPRLASEWQCFPTADIGVQIEAAGGQRNGGANPDLKTGGKYAKSDYWPAALV